MMLRNATLLLTAILLCGISARGQQSALHGIVSDTLNHQRLAHASVTLTRAKDSLLSTFTRSASDGAFSLQPDSAGRFIILVTYPGFADYVDYVTVQPGENIDLGPIPMISRTHLMNEFILHKEAAAIKIKGDTTEYVADSFKVREGATVEDLLKKLPGLQVDKNGVIMAQGEKVEKILVDGEEFFSDDPAVVTKNLQAKALDKVQVFDKKSDQATFTGIDDGQKTKTINLQLKDNMKRGVFGKAQAGGGTDGYFENQGMINAFRGKRQISFFGIMSNTGKVGLGWEDRSKYGSGNNTEFDEETGDSYTFFNNSDDDLSANWNGNYNGEGLPTVWTGGAHYADRWSEDKQHASGDYRYAKQNVEVAGNTTTQYIIPDSGYTSAQRRNTFTSAQRHGGDGLYEWKIDSSSNLKVTVDGNYITTHNASDYYTESHGEDGSLINTSSRNLTTDASNKSINSTALWRKKMKKKGRNISLDLREEFKATDGIGYLLSNNQYFTPQPSADSVDQRKNNTTNTLGLHGKITYTEPLSKSTFLSVNYGLNLLNASADKFSYNRLNGDWSPTPDSLYSSSYRYAVTTQSGGASLRFVTKKYNVSLGAEIFNTHFNQHDLLRDSVSIRNYNNFAPTAALTWTISKQSHLKFNYNGNTQQPTLDQIQPLHQNTDPLNIAVGNPELKQEFDHHFNLNYNSYKALSGSYTYAGGGFNFVQDDIVQSQNVDAQLVRTYHYVNVNGDYSGYFYGGTGRKVGKHDIQLSLSTNIQLGHQNNFVDSVLNTSRINSYTLEAGLDKSFKKNDKEVAGINIRPGITYNDNHATISTFSTSYRSSEITTEDYVELPHKFRLSTVVQVNLRQRTDVFATNNNVVRWDATLARKFFKGDQLELRLSVFDILNQNIGFSRTASGNVITENSYNTIRRYGLLSLVWNFTKSPAGAAPASGK